MKRVRNQVGLVSGKFVGLSAMANPQFGSSLEQGVVDNILLYTQMCVAIDE